MAAGESLRAEQKKLSPQPGKRAFSTTQFKNLRTIGRLSKEKAKEAADKRAELDSLMLEVPNLPHPLAPVSRTPAS